MSDGCWYASFDDGVTWHNLGKVGEEGEQEPLFSDVRYDEEYVYLTLADGTEIPIPMMNPYDEGPILSPYVEIGHIDSEGKFSKKYYARSYYRTPRYVMVKGNELSVRILKGGEFCIFQYDKSYKFIKTDGYVKVSDDEWNLFVLDPSCRFIKCGFRKSSSAEEFPLPVIYLKNVHQDEIYAERPATDGVETLMIPVNISGPSTSDNESWDMQDAGQILPDYGVLMLPETYTNVGKPTRLIIYCHGAGATYSSSSISMSSLDPEYWLKEGYAIMDIDGNPFDNSNSHGYIPQASQAYKCAYNWVVNTYNIYKDGIFLGGRSMGGGMCFDLLQTDIPIIAACPLVPVCNQLWWWNYMNADRRKFCAEKMGFTGTAPTWTSSKKMSDEEYQYLYDNFDKMVKYSPFWRGIENMPDKDVLFSVGHVSASTKHDEAETALFSTLRFKVKAPVKIFGCHEDATVPPKRNAELMYQMMKNAGQVCELRMFHTDASSPHQFEREDSRHLTEVTTVYGETMQAPLVYVEMLKFWRRYEHP